jgi:flagellar hook assembly protein FlgD
MTFKYRNKFPANGKIYLTDDNKSFYIKLTHKKDIDKIEVFDIKNNYMKKLKLYKKEWDGINEYDIVDNSYKKSKLYQKKWDGINEYIIIDNSYQKSKLYRIHKYSIR